MRLLPRSLLWRTVLAVTFIVVAGQFAWLEIVHYYQSREGAEIAVEQMAINIELQQHALEAMPDNARASYMKRLEQQRHIHFEPAVPGFQPGQEPETPGLKALAERLRASMGPQVALRIESPDPHLVAGRPTPTDPGPEPGQVTGGPYVPGSGNGPPTGRRIWVKLPVAGQEIWMVLHQRRPPPPPPWVLLEWGMMVMVLAIGASVFILLRLRTPLRQLSLAARQIGRGEEPSLMSGQGPAEIVELQKSFAQMQADLKRMENDRALVLAGISHDLRTPLARMRLSAEMLNSDPSARAGMVSDIEEMDAIINQFLDFARDAAGEAPRISNINDVLSLVVDHYGKLNHPVQMKLTPLPDLALRPTGIRRLINNLVDNALRYGGRVEAETRREGNDVVVEIKDRGPGIPAADLERVKQPFTRLDPSRTGSSGAGLGLAIAERVVRQHGGSLELSTREGGGLIAQIRLPLAAA
jgi:two-component system, OmpR family, osmolarity sensor histidine kinase EnvZ